MSHISLDDRLVNDCLLVVMKYSEITRATILHGITFMLYKPLVHLRQVLLTHDSYNRTK